MLEKNDAILITGAEGFVGTHVVAQLQKSGFTNIHGTGFRDVSRLAEKLGQDHAWKIDLEDQESVNNLLKQLQPKAIFHFAARPSVNESYEKAWMVIQTNAHLQLVMLEAVRQFSPRSRVLAIGSAAAYGRIALEKGEQPIPESTAFKPENPYAVSKITQEFLSLVYFYSYGLDVVMVRPFNMIGPGQSSEFAIPSFAHQVAKIERGQQETLLVGNLEATRDFTDVRDAAVAFEVLMQSAVKGEVYNLGSGTGNKMQVIVDTYQELSTAKVPVAVDPQRLRPSDVPYFVADNSKLRDLGWKPTHTLRETLQDVLNFEREKLKENA